MSIKLMTLVWELDLSPGEKLVLLALADQANDEGRQCWPSVATIAHRSGQGERTVRRAFAELEKKGHLTRDHRDGNSTQYHVHPCQNGTPAKSAPLPKTTKTPAKMAAKPPRTTKPKKDKPSLVARAKFVLPANIPSEAWEGFEEMRRRIGKPLTDYARSLAVKRLDALAEDGWPPGDVLNHCTMNSYQGIFPPKDRNNGRSGTYPVAGNQPSDGLGRTARAALRAFPDAARSAGAGHT
jgi:hypothetical protein